MPRHTRRRRSRSRNHMTSPNPRIHQRRANRVLQIAILRTRYPRESDAARRGRAIADAGLESETVEAGAGHVAARVVGVAFDKVGAVDGVVRCLI